MGQRFGALLEAGARGELSGWRVNAAGRLAEIVLLDQFSRNIYRDTPQAFAQDGMALVLADHPGSFDSRYFGFVPLDSLQRVKPVFVFNPKGN